MTTNLVLPFALIIFFGVFATSPSLTDSYNNTITNTQNIENTNSWDLISQDTFPSRSNSRETYRTNNNGKRIHLVVENGKVKKLRINGKKIAKNEFEDFADLIKDIRSSSTPTLPNPSSTTHPPYPPTPPNTMDAHERNIEVHNRQIAEHEKEAKENGKTSELFADQLLQDGLISDKENFSFSLSLKKFEVDGKSQNKNIRDKYIRLYELESGKAMSSKSTYTVTFGSF